MENLKIGDWKGSNNAGYVRRLVLVPDTDIEYLPDPSLLLGYTDAQLINMADVPINADAQTITFDFPAKTCQYNLSQNQSNDGPLYLISIQGLLPKLLAAIARNLGKGRNLRWIAFFQDHNSNFYIAGTPDYPLTLTYSQSINDQNNTAIFVAGRTPNAPLNTTALPILTRTFSTGFSRAFA